MAKIHTLTYNGTKSSDLGVFVTGSGSFDAAELDVDKYEIPGRNGDLILSNNRYKNIEITYPAFIPKAFMDKAQNVRNWMRSSRVYARLEDTYDTDHYRLGIPTGVQSFSPANRNDGANFEMTFDCKPQRFLKAGETPETVEVEEKSASGEIASFETDYVVPLTSAEVSLSPIQDLNGYDSPWPAGGGKNLLKTNDFADYTNNGVTWHRNDDGSVVLNGTATARSYKYLNGGYYLKLESGTYTVSASGLESGGAFGNLSYGTTENGSYAGTFGTLGGTIPKRTFTVENTIYLGVLIDVPSGTTNSNRLIKVQIEEGSTATEWTPYSNICPISGHTGAELIRTGKNLAFPGAFVQGTINSATGQITSSGTRIASMLFPAESGKRYYIATDADKYVFEVYEFDANKTKIYSSAINAASGFITTRSNTAWVRYSVKYPNNAAITPSAQTKAIFTQSDTAVELDSDGDTYSVTFSDQGTVYGGTFDFVSGKLTVTKAVKTLDGSETYSWHNSGVAYTAIPGGIITNATTQYQRFVLCDKLQSASWAERTTFENCCGMLYGASYVFIKPSGVANATEAKAWVAANNLQIVYELATPLEYDLSPQQIETLLGENNVWSDAGPITLTYAEPFTIENPTIFDARPLFTVTNPAEGDVIMVNGQAITFVDGYSGTVFIDCETMNAYSGAANLNSIIEATDFPVLVPGTNIITWTGTGVCTMTPRWWEL